MKYINIIVLLFISIFFTSCVSIKNPLVPKNKVTKISNDKNEHDLFNMVKNAESYYWGTNNEMCSIEKYLESSKKLIQSNLNDVMIDYLRLKNMYLYEGSNFSYSIDQNLISDVQKKLESEIENTTNQNQEILLSAALFLIDILPRSFSQLKSQIDLKISNLNEWSYTPLYYQISNYKVKNHLSSDLITKYIRIFTERESLIPVEKFFLFTLKERMTNLTDDNLTNLIQSSKSYWIEACDLWFKRLLQNECNFNNINDLSTTWANYGVNYNKNLYMYKKIDKKYSELRDKYFDCGYGGM